MRRARFVSSVRSSEGHDASHGTVRRTRATCVCHTFPLGWLLSYVGRLLESLPCDRPSSVLDTALISKFFSLLKCTHFCLNFLLSPPSEGSL